MGRLWLMKSEPDVYGWDDLIEEGEGTWDGVRNYRARNNLQAMAVGDQALFYHSNIGKEIVGIVTISVAGLPDPTDETGRWASVKVTPLRKLARPVTLAEIPMPGSPLYAAGLDRGDTIVAVDGQRIASAADWRAALAAMKPGVAATLAVVTRAGASSAVVTPVADPKFAIVPLEKAGGKPSAAQIAFRRAWLGTD